MIFIEELFIMLLISINAVTIVLLLLHVCYCSDCFANACDNNVK